MKTFTFILLGGLFLFQPAFDSYLPLVVNKAIMSDSGKKIKKPVNIQLLRRESVTRSLPSMIPGYVEEGILYICFGTPIANKYLQVIDTSSGEIIYSDVFSGTALIIPLIAIGGDYVVEVL